MTTPHVGSGRVGEGLGGYYYATTRPATVYRFNATSVLASYIVFYNSAAVYVSALLNPLLLLLLMILYIDFLQMHSRHRQTHIFSHCFKQSE